MSVSIISFITGAVLSAVVAYIIYSKKVSEIREELITLKAKSEVSVDLQELIKNDFMMVLVEDFECDYISNSDDI